MIEMRITQQHTCIFTQIHRKQKSKQNVTHKTNSKKIA